MLRQNGSNRYIQSLYPTSEDADISYQAGEISPEPSKWIRMRYIENSFDGR